MLDEKPLRELEASLHDKMGREAEQLGRMIEHNSRGAFQVFWPTFLAVIIGGYVVKYWL